MKRGTIVWSTGLDKRRPILVVSPEFRNATAHDVLAVPLSASSPANHWHVRFNRGESGLPRACVAKCEQINLVRHEWIEGPVLGTISEAKMREVELAMMDALGIAAPSGA